jgi:hypothetical protein
VTFNRRAALAVVGFLLSPPGTLLAQSWAVDVYAGGTRYDPLVSQVSTTNLVGNLRFEPSPRARFYVSAAAPLDSVATVWGAVGAASSLERFLRAGMSAGVDLGVDGYGFDDRSSFSGTGAVLYALPHVRFIRGITTLEVRGGGHRHIFSYPDTSGGQGLLELAAQGTVVAAAVTAQASFRWLSASEGSYPYASGRVEIPLAPARLWAWAGKWLAEELDAAEWGVGASLAVPYIGDVWAGFRQDGSDPLYFGTERRSWNVGVTRSLGASSAVPATLVPRVARGAVRIRLPGELVDANTAPSVAGEFSEWQTVPMARDGEEWVLDLPLQAGVYRFSFVTSGGEWFVPERYPGRIDDGFGGWVVLLVVP